jgi:hypothetical protein
MHFGRIEIFPARNEENSYTVIADGRFCKQLTKDEALGVVASILFGEKPIFLRTYEAWVATEKRLSDLTEYREPAALLAGQKGETT